MYKLNISRKLIILCARLQLENHKPRLTKRCPIALAADTIGLHDAIACRKYLTWREYPGSPRRVKAENSPTITEWIRRFDQYHKYPNMLLQHVPSIVIQILEYPIPTETGATHIVDSRTKLGIPFIQRTPRMVRKANTPAEFEKILKDNTQIESDNQQQTLIRSDRSLRNIS